MRGEAVFGKQSAKHHTVKENFSKSTIFPYGLCEGRKVAQGGKFVPDANLELLYSNLISKRFNLKLTVMLTVLKQRG
jgi:hypothetical protein